MEGKQEKQEKQEKEGKHVQVLPVTGGCIGPQLPLMVTTDSPVWPFMARLEKKRALNSFSVF